MAATSAQVPDVQDQEVLVGGGCGLSWPGCQFQFCSPGECEEYAVVAVVVLEAAGAGSPIRSP